jgi:hypothetical protein
MNHKEEAAMERVTLTFQKTPGTRVPTIDGIGEVSIVRRDDDQTPCGFRFPQPFDHLAIVDGEPVTPELRAQVAEAVAYFARS